MWKARKWAPGLQCLREDFHSAQFLFLRAFRVFSIFAFFGSSLPNWILFNIFATKLNQLHCQSWSFSVPITPRSLDPTNSNTERPKTGTFLGRLLPCLALLYHLVQYHFDKGLVTRQEDARQWSSADDDGGVLQQLSSHLAAVTYEPPFNIHLKRQALHAKAGDNL